MPTISASQVLQKIKENLPRAIPTGLPLLDNILLGRPLGGQDVGAKRARGGLTRGKVAEIYGPPGVGKTAFGLQTAAITLRDGNKVIWVDCGTPLVRKRLEDFLSASKPPDEAVDPGSEQAGSSIDQILQKQFFHYTTPTLPHLLALFLHPAQSFPPRDTSLIVIDSVSTLFDLAFHRPFDYAVSSKKSDQEKWAASRRFAIMGDLISKIGRMAALHDIAVLLTCQTTTRLRSGIGLGALLLPAMSGVEWGNGIATQLVLFRDWSPNDAVNLGEGKERWERLRYAGVIKVNGVLTAEEGRIDRAVPFSVEKVRERTSFDISTLTM